MARSCKMTKMHFQLIAKIINDLNVGKTKRRDIANYFATCLRSTNPAFNAERFVDACCAPLRDLWEPTDD